MKLSTPLEIQRCPCCYNGRKAKTAYGFVPAIKSNAARFLTGSTSRAASCKNKKFGHNFPYPDAKCLNCGMEQEKISDKSLSAICVNPRAYPRRSTALKNLHSQNHLLADDISKFLNEPKKFAMYLGIICRIGFETANRIFSEIKQSKAKDKAKLFMWRIGQLKSNIKNFTPPFLGKGGARKSK